MEEGETILTFVALNIVCIILAVERVPSVHADEFVAAWSGVEVAR